MLQYVTTELSFTEFIKLNQQILHSNSRDSGAQNASDEVLFKILFKNQKLTYCNHCTCHRDFISLLVLNCVAQ